MSVAQVATTPPTSSVTVKTKSDSSCKKTEEDAIVKKEKKLPDGAVGGCLPSLMQQSPPSPDINSTRNAPSVASTPVVVVEGQEAPPGWKESISPVPRSRLASSTMNKGKGSGKAQGTYRQG